jgi:hypothetical protein
MGKGENMMLVVASRDLEGKVINFAKEPHEYSKALSFLCPRVFI